MISIIICSAKSEVLAVLKKNIEETVGIQHEIISIDNSQAKKGICSIYNQGALQARYTNLCFVHEDVRFETFNWGKIVCTHLEDNKTGLIGLAGGDTKGPLPTSWSVSILSNEINIVQHYKNGKNPEHIVKSRQPGALKSQVVALDGVFLCTRKDVFDEFKFDENTFTGFHGYDIDYSLQVGTKYNLYVIFDIVVHHYSEGSADRSWVKSAFLISKKWQERLPVSVHDLSAYEMNYYYWRSMQISLQKMFELNFPVYKIFAYYLLFSWSKYFRIRRFLSMGKYILLRFTSHKSLKGTV